MLLVDLGRSDIGRLSRPGTVEVQKLMAAERFAHVTLLTSRITGELKEGLDAVDVLSSSFPAGTVCGVPRIRAAEVTAALEPQARGPYAGCIGWLGLDRDAVHLDTGITMRSMWVREGRLYWQAGARILHDADPGQEWEKAVTRAEIMRRLCSASGGGYVPAHR
jgi:anthranilate synthase component 1